MSTKNVLTDHLAEIDESYSEHLRVAFTFGVRMVTGGMACIIHAILPFTFQKTGSKCITKLHDEMVTNRGDISKRRSGVHIA